MVEETKKFKYKNPDGSEGEFEADLRPLDEIIEVAREKAKEPEQDGE